AQGAFQRPRSVDRLDIPPGTPSSAYALPEGGPVGTGYPGPVGGRDRDWMDIGQIPSRGDPWAGFEAVANDNAPMARAMAMDAEAMPRISAPLRQRDYINVSPADRPQRMDQPLS